MYEKYEYEEISFLREESPARVQCGGTCKLCPSGGLGMQLSPPVPSLRLSESITFASRPSLLPLCPSYTSLRRTSTHQPFAF